MPQVAYRVVAFKDGDATAYRAEKVLGVYPNSDEAVFAVRAAVEAAKAPPVPMLPSTVEFDADGQVIA